MTVSDRTQSALDFIAHCTPEVDLQALIAEFRTRVLEFGFSASVCGAWTGVARQRRYRFFFNDWPQSWKEIYMRHDIFYDDPFVAEARRRMTVFLWSEVRSDRPATPRERKIYQLVDEYGWREVVGIPVHGPNGYQGLVSLGTLTDVTLDPTQRTLLHMMGLAIHHRCRTEIDFGMAAVEAPKLAPREIECLQWVAAGKTDGEIGILLGISPATAHYHVESAKRKLGVASRVQAVALLSLRGIV